MEPDIATRSVDLLRQLTGHADAELRDDQLEAITALVADRRRVLLVQRTGWGKSAVYFIATKILRESGAGPTILVSPLLALMRNQIEAAARMGVRAVTLNSSNQAEWDDVRDAIDRNEVDLLLIAPERFANRGFRTEVLPVVSPRSGLLVVDEAHCISDWGHDFRPDYRRVTRMLEMLPPGVPVLACTATANDRVVADVASQLGDDLLILRGPLARAGLALRVVDMASQAQRLAWLATVVPDLPGTGIVYCLTIRDTRIVADWLRHQGLSAVAYSGDSDPETRLTVESQLLDNDVKVVAATSALGMGFDKPDLAFVVHYQSPGSPIAYYQQVGRAGRQLDTSHGVLLRGAEDEDIQDFFIRRAFPPQIAAEAVVTHLESVDDYVRIQDLEGVVNLPRTRIETMMKQLEADEAIESNGLKYRRTPMPWTYDTERVDGVTAQRRSEQEQMRTYALSDGCRMAFLENLLDDPEPVACGVCDNCMPLPEVAIDPELVRDAVEFLRNRPLTIAPRKRNAENTAIPKDEQILEGRTLAKWSDAGWGTLVRRGKRDDGRFDDELVTAAAKLVADWQPDPAPTWITYVPSLRSGPLIADFAERLGEVLGLPVVAAIAQVRATEHQVTMHNSAQQSRNVSGAFEVVGALPEGPVLLVDDTVDSRWTLTEVGAVLRRAGCPAIHPLALADAGSA